MEVAVCTHSDLYLEAVLSIDVWTDVALAVSLKPTIVNSFASCSDEVDIKSLCDVYVDELYIGLCLPTSVALRYCTLRYLLYILQN